MSDTIQTAFNDAKRATFDYTPDVFRTFFTTPFDQYRDRIGQRFTVLGHDLEAESSLDEFEDMYRITFEDGTVITAWGHEVCILSDPA